MKTFNEIKQQDFGTEFQNKLVGELCSEFGKNTLISCYWNGNDSKSADFSFGASSHWGIEYPGLQVELKTSAGTEEEFKSRMVSQIESKNNRLYKEICSADVFLIAFVKKEHRERLLNSAYNIIESREELFSIIPSAQLLTVYRGSRGILSRSIVPPGYSFLETNLSKMSFQRATDLIHEINSKKMAKFRENVETLY